MRISKEYEGARLNMRRTAELLVMDDAHLRRLVRRGIFPKPKRTTKGLPYYDFELLSLIGGVLKSGVGVSGEEVAFYRRKPKNSRANRTSKRSASQSVTPDAFVESIIQGCRQLGVGEDLLGVADVTAIVVAEFGDERPSMETAIPVVARRLLGG